mgnify:CR=1 FL=1
MANERRILARSLASPSQRVVTLGVSKSAIIAQKSYPVLRPDDILARQDVLGASVKREVRRQLRSPLRG